MRTILPILLAALALSLPACGEPAAVPGGEAAPPNAGPDGAVIRVSATYPGANARVVVDTLAAPIEQQVNGVEGLTRLESESRDDGGYTLTARFAPGTDLDAALVLVQKRVNLATPVLPEEVRRQGVTVRKVPDGPPAFWLALTSPDGKFDALFLTNYARLRVKDELARLPGVADVRVISAGDYAVRLWLDPEKLAARELTAADVVRAIERQNAKVAVGQVGQPPKGQALQYTLTMPGRLSDPAEFERVVVKTTGGGQVVYLRDVGRVELGASAGEFARVNGKPAALVAVTPWRGKLTAKEVRKTGGWSETLPEGVRAELVADWSAGGVVVVDVRLPDAASRERTQEATDRATKLIRELPGGPDCTAFGDDREPNVATILVKLPQKNGPTAADIRKALSQIPDATVRVSNASAGREPFPVRIAVCDTGEWGVQDLRTTVDAVAQRLTADTAVTDLSVFPGRSVSQLWVTLDRHKLKELEVSAADVVATLRTATGVRVDDFNQFGRDFVIPLVPGPRMGADDLARLKVRNAKGEMVPLGAVAAFGPVEGEQVVVRVNLYPALILSANPPDGTAPAAAAARCLKLAERELPKGYRAENLTRPAN